MEKINVLGHDFDVQKLQVMCVNASYFSTQAWSSNRIYSLTISQSNIVGKSYDDLLNDLDAVCDGSSMRGANVNHIAVVDTNLRKAVLAKMLKTENDLEKAINENDDTFFAAYDKLIVGLYLNKQLNVCKVTLDISTLTNGARNSYKTEINGKVTEGAATRDVFDFASGIQKSVLSAAADMLSAVEDDEDEDEEE